MRLLLNRQGRIRSMPRLSLGCGGLWRAVAGDVAEQRSVYEYFRTSNVL